MRRVSNAPRPRPDLSPEGSAEGLCILRMQASFDFCQFQRFVNSLGGVGPYRAHSRTAMPGDRLSEYGFCSGIGLVRPEWPGVYAITYVSILSMGEYEHLLYIGSSQDIWRRIRQPGHLYRLLQERSLLNDSMYVRTLRTNDYRTAERSLIQTLKPWLNIQHK